MRQQLDRMKDSVNEDDLDESLEMDENDYYDIDDSDGNEGLNARDRNNEVFMLLTGEQDLAKFLHWAMQLLYPSQFPAEGQGGSAAEFYHPGMYIWKKYNLSGHLEPPLIVEEPHYVLVRREKQNQKENYPLGGEHA